MTEQSQSVLLQHRDNGVSELILNRPEVHNAFDDAVIAEMLECLEQTDKDPAVKVLVLRSNGKNFSAGADLGWMKRMAANSHQENLEDAGRLALLMERLNNHSKPTIALIQGAAFGGAVGLAACCDIVIATEASLFCLSEVKIGLIPAVISPYVVTAIGERQARRYFVTAEAFSATEAKGFGLVHQVVPEAGLLDDACQRFVDQLGKNSPQAMHAAKQLVYAVSGRPVDAEVINDTVQRIADIRVSEEGQEGLSAFLQKRKPSWIQE